MIKKALFFSSFTLLLVAVVASLGLTQPKVNAQGLAPDPAAPNCYQLGSNGYERVDCGPILAFFSQGPMLPGHCYVDQSSPTVLISVTETPCDKITGGTTTTTPVSTTSPTTVTREEAIHCDGKDDPAKLKDCLQNKNPLITRITEAIDFLGIGVGVVVVIMIIIGGIQYAMAGSNPQAVSAAKKRILSAVIAFVAFLLLYSVMQWLVPGGIF